VDDFPARRGTAADFRRFHRIARDHGIPYLLGVTPFLDRGEGPVALTPEESEVLRQCLGEGGECALHGFTHRRRYRNYPSELAGMGPAELRRNLARADDCLRRTGATAVGFVAPFNGYSPHTLSILAERFPLLGGGPESVEACGYRAGPCAFLGATYVPSYRGVYDVDGRALRSFDALAASAADLVLPVAIHWTNGLADGFRSFEALCQRLAGRTLAWSSSLAHVAAVRALAGPDAEEGTP
jgi:peptidoglycan/xylan/chitin deacetylase (PgdA/CDA1 family)